MKDLQTVAMGMAIVFLDAGSGGWDWVADPLGWMLVLVGLAQLKDVLPSFTGIFTTAWVCLAVSVLTYPPGSVVTIDDSLGWVFSLPTLAFCWLVCDGLADITPEGLSGRLRLLRALFVVVAALPLLLYVADWEWLDIPVAVAAVGTNLFFLVALWDASNEEPLLLEEPVGEPADDADG